MSNVRPRPIALFTRANEPMVDFYTNVFGFTTDWDGIRHPLELSSEGIS